MNFHALLRVEKARKQALLLSGMRTELEKMLRGIVLNRNLRLDKLLRLPDARLPALRIYLGSDYGFCGSVNSSVSGILARDAADAEKIVIGKKIRGRRDVSLSLTWDEYYRDIGAVHDYFVRAVRERSYSAIELVYNRYNNLGNVKLEERRIYPVAVGDFGEADEGTKADYIIESDITGLLEEMMIAYSFYEFRIAVTSSYASENTLRQSSTQESIKKLDEREAEETRVARKEKSELGFRKTIDNYTRQSMLTRA
jgi:F0F1-type ATP synthase gamma subunit